MKRIKIIILALALFFPSVLQAQNKVFFGGTTGNDTAYTPNSLMVVKKVRYPLYAGTTDTTTMFFDPQGNAYKVTKSMIQGWSLTANSGKIPYSDTLNRTILTKKVRDSLLLLHQELRDIVVSKQDDNDTATTDATRYWVSQNYAPGLANNYIQNQNSTTQTANAKISGTFEAQDDITSSKSIISAYSEDIGSGAFLINRVVNPALASPARGFRDNTYYDTEGIGYCSFDAVPKIGYGSTNNYDHVVALQARPVMYSSGTIGHLSGGLALLEVQGGTATNTYGWRTYDVTGAGNVTNQYGFYCNGLLKGTNNWAFYADGATPSYFGGDVTTAKHFVSTYTEDTGSPDAAILVNRTVNPVIAANSRSFRDNTYFNRPAYGHNSYDAVPKIGFGDSNNYDGVTGFQSRPVMYSSGTINNMFAGTSLVEVQGGTATNVFGWKVYDVTGAGSVTNQYGFYCDSLQKATNNWAIYIDGTTKSYFGGWIGIGATSPTNPLDVNGTARIRTISNGIGDFLTTDANGVITKRTAAQTLSDISAEPAFSKNTAFNKNFGTASNTVAEGNDSRINNGQTAFTWGNHAGLYHSLSTTYAYSGVYTGDFNSITGNTSLYANTGSTNVPGNGHVNAYGLSNLFSYQTWMDVNGGDNYRYQSNFNGTWGTEYRVASREWVTAQNYVVNDPVLTTFTGGVSASYILATTFYAAAVSNPSTSNNSNLALNDAGIVMSRNIADANAAVISVQANPSSTGDIHQFYNSSGVKSAIDITGAFKPAILSDAAAPNNSIYYSTDASKLVYKDAGGVVNNLY